MIKITENDIELLAIEKLEALGYQYIYAPNIGPDGEAQERISYEEVVLEQRLRSAITLINPTIPKESQEEALKEVLRIHSPELLTNNETFHRMLTEGIKVSYQQNGIQRGDLVWLIDFQNTRNNEFIVANQFTVIENASNELF